MDNHIDDAFSGAVGVIDTNFNIVFASKDLSGDRLTSAAVLTT